MAVGWETDILTDLHGNTAVLSAPSAKNHLKWLNHRTIFIWFCRLFGWIDCFPQSNCTNSPGQHSLHFNNSSESPLCLNQLFLNVIYLLLMSGLCAVMSLEQSSLLVFICQTALSQSDLCPKNGPSRPYRREVTHLEDWSKENRLLLNMSKTQETDGKLHQEAAEGPPSTSHRQSWGEKSGHLGILGSDHLTGPVLD